MTSTEQGAEGVDLDEKTLSARDVEDEFLQYANDRPGDTQPFYELEGKVLDLWDRLNDLKLEIAINEAVPTVPESSFTDEELPSELAKAEKDCLEARGLYLLSQSTTLDTLITPPILSAIHNGANASSTERALKPLLDRRDGLEIASTNLAASLQEVEAARAERDVASLRLRKENAALVREVRELVGKVKEERGRGLGVKELEGKIEGARKQEEDARRQWRIMKSVVRGVVVGSGVDWVGDEKLRELVLDAEDEEKEGSV